MKWRSLLLGVAISAISIWFLLRSIDPRAVGESFAQADWRWVLAGLPFMAVALIARCWRWQVLFLPDARVSFVGASAATLVSYLFNTLLPGRVGELVRASLVSQTDGVSTARALGAIFVEKLMDVFMLLVILGALTAFTPLPGWVTAAGISAIVTFGAVAVVFFALSAVRRRMVAWLERTLDRVPMLARLQPSRLIELLLSAADGLRQPRLLALNVALLVVMWTAAVGQVMMLSRAFQLEAGWTAAALVLVTTNLGMTVPSAPGYVGVYHAIVVLTLSLFGIEAARSLSFAVTMHAVGFGLFSLLGMVALIVGLARQAYRPQDLWRWRQPPARATVAPATAE
jgi:uncharacterized protein (TIRG00374 family)